MAKIIGNTTATPNPRPDWNQTDETKADYIKNKPEVDRTYDPTSENAQSGIAVSEALADIAVGSGVYVGSGEMPEGYNVQIDPNGEGYELPITDPTYNPESENAQSGIAVAEAITQAVGDIETALDNIIEIQNQLIGGDSE